MINMTNDLYRQRGLAVIQKVPTPITPIEVDNKRHTISKAYFGKTSTVDYIGAVQGFPVCFDAKETNMGYLPLSNIHSHQMSFMEAYQKQGGICFILISFRLYNEVYYLPFPELAGFAAQAGEGGRKSVPYDGMRRIYRVTSGKGFPLHYLEAINVYLQEAKVKNES
jgi:recombination protein U